MPSDFPSAAMQRFGIRVTEFELDMLAVALNGLAADGGKPVMIGFVAVRLVCSEVQG